MSKSDNTDNNDIYAFTATTSIAREVGGDLPVTVTITNASSSEDMMKVIRDVIGADYPNAFPPENPPS